MFEEHCASDLLNLNASASKFSKFFTILCGENLDIWRDIIEDINQTSKTFKSSIEKFIGNYLVKGDLEIPREYFLTKCIKGQSQTVKDIN